MEQWRDIPGHEGAYQVSDLGRVRSLDREVRTHAGVVKSCRGRILRQRARPDGYKHVCLYTQSRQYQCRLVHRLVLLAFVGEPEAHQKHTRHLDGSRGNNALANLRWATAEENMEDVVYHGRRRFTPEEVRHIRASCVFGERGTKSCLAKRYGVSTPLISYIALGKAYSYV